MVPKTAQNFTEANQFILQPKAHKQLFVKAKQNEEKQNEAIKNQSSATSAEVPEIDDEHMEEESTKGENNPNMD